MKHTIRYRKILWAANFVVRSIGLKQFAVSHLSEKLSGDRPLSWADLDAIQSAVPADLLSWWCHALCYPLPVSVASSPVADEALPNSGHPALAATLYLPPDPPAACAVIKEAA